MRTTRIATALAGGALLAGTLTAPAQAADPVPPSIGGSWVSGELTNGLIHNNEWNFDDYGLTIDAAYALQETGRASALPGITTALQTNVDNYITGGQWGPNDWYAGATGKMLSFVTDLTDADPTSFGGRNLVTRMEDLTLASGRIADQTISGDNFANVFGQAWAARGLNNANSAEADEALGFLLTQQCAAGWFRQDFTKVAGAATDGSCDADATASPSTDTTSVAITLLDPLVAGSPEVAEAQADAAAWLATQQRADGSFVGGGTIGPNTNSTGLAGWALRLADRGAAATKAATWIRARQVPGRSCDGALRGQRGAVAYDPAQYDSGVSGGIPVTTEGTWRRSTIGSLAALKSAPSPTTALGVRAPKFLDAGRSVRPVARGLAAGERACLAFGAASKAVIGGSVHSVQFAVPNRTARRTIQLQTADTVLAKGVVALAAKTLRFDHRGRVRPGSKQLVKVRGLWPGESVQCKRDGKTVKSGRARADGTFACRFDAGKRGRHKVLVVGHFGDRRGAAAYRVG